MFRVVRVIEGFAGLAIRVLRNRDYATPRVPRYSTAFSRQYIAAATQCLQIWPHGSALN